MKVLSISTDRKIFEEGSPVVVRSLGYANKMEELHVVVFTRRKEGLKLTKINNLYLYPTNSLTEWLYVYDAMKLCKKIILENKFINGQSVISVQDPFQTGFVGVKISKKFNFPIQVQIHTDFLSPYFSRSFFNIIRRMIASFVIPRASSLRVVSEVIEESLKNHFPNINVPINVLPIFVDIEKIIEYKADSPKVFPDFTFVIFMASRLTKEKRIDISISALKNIVSKFPHTGLVIAGEGPQKNNLESQVKKLGLEKNVVFIGWQNNLIPFYKTANMFLLTSEYEGYGMTLIEAGASGCPIVTTKVGIAKTSLFKDGENCSICPVSSVECVTETVLYLISDNSKRELFKHRMQDSIRNTATNYEDYLVQYVALLESLITKFNGNS